MERDRLIRFSCLATVAMCFVSCSQEELSSPTELVEGAYPLQIATVTIADGQPSTRVTENEDRMGSTWQVGDRIFVKFEGRNEVGTLRVTDAATGAVEVVEPIYWTSQSATVIAWHTSTGSRNGMDVSDQTGGIAYMVGCKAQATFGEEANLTLSHRLSKVRVYIDGVDSPTSVAMVYPSSYTITEGEISPSEQNNTILMYPTTVNGKACYEATVAPGAMATSTNSIIVMQGTIKHEIFLDNNLTLEAGKVNEVTVTINGGSTEITPSTGNISGNGSYSVTGDYNGAINIAGGSPLIHLNNANISNSSGPAINITGNATPTILVVGLDNSVTSSNGAGIYVAEGSTVTILGRNRENNLTVSGSNGSSGVGGNMIANDEYANCGNIIIDNITITASGSSNGIIVAPGIGSAGDATCGTITINEATVYAYGATSDSHFAPAIGCGYPGTGSPTSIPAVIMKNSTVYAHRGGNNTDFIGWAGDLDANTSATNTCNFGTGGICTNSTIYCYTGENTATDYVFVYDANGNRTEQSQ